MGTFHSQMGTFALPPLGPRLKGALRGAGDASIPYHCSDPASDAPRVSCARRRVAVGAAERDVETAGSRRST